VWVEFVLQTDIWFPWLFRAQEILERCPGDVKQIPACRNPLAQHHTPRLNRFLAVARSETMRIGGTWELNKDFSSGLFMLDENGIRLNAELPDNFLEVQI